MFRLLKKIYRDQSLLRILMDEGFAGYALKGKVIDIGGGRDPDYFNYFDMEKVTSHEPLDASISGIDFEKDALPFESASIDSLVCANVLEHIYNHNFLVGEMYRILKPDGQLVGFVPFLIQYHPDPHDYFRYTKEALIKIFSDAGFHDVTIKTVGGGPLYANFNTIMLSVPLIARAILFPFYFLLDKLFLKLRPGVRDRVPLGFIFSMRK